MKKLVMLGLFAAVIISGFTLSSVTAYADDSDTPASGFGPRIRHGLVAIADFLGMDAEELRDARQEGKTVEDLLTEQGKTRDDLHEYMEEKAIERMQERGLSDDEIADRLQWMEERHENWDGDCMLGKGTPMGPMGEGFGKGRFQNQ